MMGVARQLDVAPHHVYSTWPMYIQQFNTGLYDRYKKVYEPYPDGSRHTFNRNYRVGDFLGDVAIRDSALMTIYDDPSLIHGHGSVRQNLLHHMLMDNHPELLIF